MRSDTFTVYLLTSQFQRNVNEYASEDVNNTAPDKCPVSVFQPTQMLNKIQPTDCL